MCFYGTILPFGLTISLRIKCDGELSLNAKEVTKRKLELGYKNYFTITDDRV